MPLVVAKFPADAHNYGSRRGATIDRIIIHTMEGTLHGTAKWFENPDAHASSHFGVGRDGSILRFVDDSYAAWHAGNMEWNRHSIGIELEGHCADPLNFSEKMMDALTDLVLDVAGRYGIPLDRKHILGHNEVPDPGHSGQFGGANHHTDPGKFFPWDHLMTSLAQAVL